MTATAKDGGEAVLEAIRRLGVEYVVTSPGSEWSPFWEAMSRQRIEGRNGPQFIQCWHETLALSIATGYTTVTGRMQAVLLHAGAGMMHGAMSLAGATRGEVPMVVLSGESVSLGEDPDRPMEPQWYAGVSVGGADRLVSPMAKWSGRVHSAVTLYQSVVRAGEMAQRAPKGPVHVDIPMEYMLEGWTPPETLRDVPDAPLQVAPSQDIERLAAALVAAKNPMIVAEQAGQDPDAYAALVRLAEVAAVPVAGVAGANFAVFPYDNPLWIGFDAGRYLRDADLVLLVGGRTPWSPPSKPVTSGRIVALGEQPIKDWLVYQNLQADEYVEGNLAHSLEALMKALEAIGVDRDAADARRAKWTTVHQEMDAKLRAERDAASQRETLSVPAIAEVMAAVMPADTIYVDETITHSAGLRQHLPLNRAQSFFRHNGGGLGQGLGLSLGIKLAARERPVVLFVGDGSLLYNPIIQAFGASKHYDLPVIVVVMNNQSYASMRRGHRRYYPEGATSNTNTDFGYGVSIEAPAFDELGQPFGFFGAKAATPGEFRAALKDALASTKDGRTAIINAAVPVPAPAG